METITLLHLLKGYESRWFQQFSLSYRDDKARHAGIASVSKAGRQVVRERGQIRWDVRVEAGVVLAWWKKQSTGEQEGQDNGSDWEEDDVMTMTRNLCWN